MNENINYLLAQVGLITRKYDEMAALTGERFNIFSIMSMESNEVYTHSAFLGELLHANGSHDLKDEPLQLFLETLRDQFKSDDNKQLFEFDTKDSWSVTEEYQGAIVADATSGGRIDIVIKNKRGQVILIENKIYAGEQGNQLTRYNQSYSKAPILFLTLDGHQPNSCGDLKENEVYFCISYQKTIIAWLEKCLRAAATLPMLREVIRQYIFLIKKLTNQTTNKKMERDIVEVLSQNLETTFEIFNNEWALKRTLIEKLKMELSSYSENNKIKFESDVTDSIKETGFYFTPAGWENRPERICFKFESKGYFDFYGGIERIFEINDEQRKNELTLKFKTAGYNTNSWNIWNYLHRNANDAKVWDEIQRSIMKNRVIEMLEEIIDIDQRNLSA